jgi:DNA replication protein DnaC
VNWTGCPKCAEEQSRRQSEEERAVAQERAKRMAEEAINAAAIPARFRNRTFESFVADTEQLAKALATVKAYADEFKRHLSAGTGLILTGPPGTGKSHLSAAVLLQLAPDHLCLYTTVSQLIRAVRDTWRKDSETSEKQLIKRLGSDVDLLVIDEVGVQYGTDAERNLLFDILDRRYADMRPTILLSNLQGDALKEVLGERVYDRMRETQRMVTFTGESYRPKARLA